MTEQYEAVVVGTGFGGAISACRLSKRWPGRVLVLERGKRYPMGSFARKPHEMARNFWNVPHETRQRPGQLPTDQQTHGLFDVRNYNRMDVVISAGLGGGSLIYANVFLEPPDEVFDERWPASCKKTDLGPYFRIAKSVLGARPVPAANGDARRRLVRTELFQEVAREMGRDSSLVDINVFFGNDFDNPTPIGVQERNRYGALQTSCVYCAECDAGCNYHSKNTLDLNYLFVAEKDFDAEILTEQQVSRIVPLDERGGDDPGADGSHGYRVYYFDLTTPGNPERAAATRRVVVSAGTLGTNELLLRCKQVHQTLPQLSGALGQRFSGNGDFLNFVMGTKNPADPNYGPVITQRIDHHLFEDFDRDRAFIIEDASYPNFLAWYVEGIKPGFLRLGALWDTLISVVRRTLHGNKGGGSVGYALGKLLGGDLSYNTAVLLSMGIDKANGVMSLDGNGWLKIEWPYKDSLPMYDAAVQAAKDFRKAARAKHSFPVPTWAGWHKKNVTVHPLGGCHLADDAANGVTSANRDNFGEVFGYKGLHVADGSLVPTAVGANPIATISALSEMVAESITGLEPDDDLLRPA